jgi:phosphate:Na+ symporter
VFTTIIIPVVTGLTIFLFGMKLMEIALHHWAGPYLQIWLERFTRTPARGLLTGTALTALLQSSTAITVISIGLVNAGILSFSRTLGVILGTNIGTCLTTELIGLSIGGIGLPLLGIGSAVWLASWLAGPLSNDSNAAINLLPGAIRTETLDHQKTIFTNFGIPTIGLTPNRRWLRSVRYGSLAMAGFSLVLLGIEIMQTIGPTLQTRGLFAWFVQQAQQSLLWGVIAGAAVTALVHSSSAVIAMAMGLASIEAIPVELGVAITLGANVGTCVTALIATIGGTRAGRFVAWSHVILNVGGTLLFYPFLHQLVSLSGIASDGHASQIARAQTIFNLASSLLALPLCYLSMWKNLESRS